MLLRFTVSRLGPISITLERRRGFYWRSVAPAWVGRLALGSGQKRLGLLFPRLLPSPGVYHVVVRGGAATLRLPLAVR